MTVNSDTKNTTQIQAHTHTTYFSQTYTKTRTQGRTLTPAKQISGLHSSNTKEGKETHTHTAPNKLKKGHTH